MKKVIKIVNAIFANLPNQALTFYIPLNPLSTLLASGLCSSAFFA
jgi:hypothetical protein